jgi:hypothetical protein
MLEQPAISPERSARNATFEGVYVNITASRAVKLNDGELSCARYGLESITTPAVKRAMKAMTAIVPMILYVRNMAGPPLDGVKRSEDCSVWMSGTMIFARPAT